MAQQGLTRWTFHETSPDVGGPIQAGFGAPTLQANGGGQVTVRWGATWDLDNRKVRYEVLRNDGQVACTAESFSVFWSLPNLSCQDTGLTPGASHTYRVRAIDPYNNRVSSPTSAPVTVLVRRGLAAARGPGPRGGGRPDLGRAHAARVSNRPSRRGRRPGRSRWARTDYAVPDDAFFVATTGDDGSPGDREQPWRTLGHAVETAPAGATIVLREGVYHEKVEIFRKKLAIQNHPGEVVWFDGSEPVTGWTADGSRWRRDDWNVQFDNTDFTAGGGEDWHMVDPQFPMANWPDQVFLDGRRLAQVRSADEVVAGTFFVDYQTRAALPRRRPHRPRRARHHPGRGPLLRGRPRVGPERRGCTPLRHLPGQDRRRQGVRRRHDRREQRLRRDVGDRPVAEGRADHRPEQPVRGQRPGGPRRRTSPTTP